MELSLLSIMFDLKLIKDGCQGLLAMVAHLQCQLSHLEKLDQVLVQGGLSLLALLLVEVAVDGSDKYVYKWLMLSITG